MAVYNLFVSKEDIAYSIVVRTEGYTVPPYQARIAKGEDAIGLLEECFGESAHWCRVNPAIARIAVAGPPGNLRLEPPAGRPSFHALVGELMELGQTQGSIRKDQSATIMAGILLGSFTQLMLYTLSAGPMEDRQIAGLVRLSIEGFGPRNKADGEDSTTLHSPDNAQEKP
jgi:AcrR family transcriptional regulator